MKKILLLFGGNSFEHDISCKSVRNIINNFDKKKYDLTICGLDKKNNFYIYNDKISCLDDNWLNFNVNRIDNPISFMKKFDKVFPVIHGNTGEDGTLLGMLEAYDIPYVGSNALSSAITYNKYLTKVILEHFNIPQVKYEILYRDDKIDTNIEYPVIVKPSMCGSSLGINIANNKKELVTCVLDAFNYSNSVLIEKYIKKRELECGILEHNGKLLVSIVGEIISCNDFYDYKAKYEDEAKILIPSNIDKQIQKEIQEYSRKMFKILNLKTYARFDFMYDYNNEKLYFNEVNTIPGFTDISMYPKLFSYMGISMKSLINRLIKN